MFVTRKLASSSLLGGDRQLVYKEMYTIQVTVAALPPFGGTKIDHPRNTLPLAVKCLEGTKSWAHFHI